MAKYIVEVQMWVKQVRPSGGSGEYEMPPEEARALLECLIEGGTDRKDIDMREV